ncbi:uncharacterized protein LOC119169695 isoform X1 [Rhipicephalus microplus]|uniref:uncharacterized protein LOC119169695 isoform X1 n=1 Tax=Rhipicephalus microplus TaxID=6941 RepID=UPI003F6BFB3E
MKAAAIRHKPRPFHSSHRDKEDIAGEPVHQTVSSAACELRQAMKTLPLPACEPGHVADKCAQVRILAHDEATQADERKLQSTSATTQTQPQAFSSGLLSSAALQKPSSLADVRSQLHACSQCTYVTLDKSTMIRHLQKHMGEPAFQCHLCPAAFTYNSKLVLHVRTHTGERPFSCVHCKASFKQERHLVKHIRTHTGERPFSCVDCKASFKLKKHLVSHISTHTRERPFSCIDCNASFKRKYDLKAHMNFHTGNYPFSCAHCNASFVRKCYLVSSGVTRGGQGGTSAPGATREGAPSRVLGLAPPGKVVNVFFRKTAWKGGGARL